MHPRKNDPPLSVIDLSTVTVSSLKRLLQETDYFGFPCVVTGSSQLLDGYITRKDVQYVVGERAGPRELGGRGDHNKINSSGALSH